jgi:hypothetical protein
MQNQNSSTMEPERPTTYHYPTVLIHNLHLNALAFPQQKVFCAFLFKNCPETV